MMLWTAADPAPNPRRVRLFLAAKRLEIPATDLSLMKREHKSPDIMARNSRGQVPFLELDDGTIITETVAICRYLDELHPEPPLFGTTPLERAQTDMWTRRVENILGVPIGLFWQHGHPFTAHLVNQIPAMAEQARIRIDEALTWFENNLAQDWLAGDRLTMADIALLSTIDFGSFIGIGIPAGHEKLLGWHARATSILVG